MKKTYLQPQTEMVCMENEEMIAASLELSNEKIDDRSELLDKQDVKGNSLWDDED